MKPFKKLFNDGAFNKEFAGGLGDGLIASGLVSGCLMVTFSLVALPVAIGVGAGMVIAGAGAKYASAKMKIEPPKNG